MTFEVKSVEARNGIRLEYVDHGDANGLPVILLHGVTDSWRSFELVLPHLPRSIRALALTQRGHGGSDKPESGYQTRDFAADVAAFADALRIDRFVVAGHSMGSINAMRVAIDFPNRVLGILLAGAFAGFRDNAVVREYWEACVSTLEDPIDPSVARDFQAGTLEHPVPEDFFEMVCSESLRVPARVWRAAFEGLLADDFVADLHRISAPALIVHASRDAFCRPEDPDALLSAIPGSRMTLYKDAGHAMHWEKPARFADDLAAFALSAADVSPVGTPQ